MSSTPAAERLERALELLARVEQTGGVREQTALAFQLDSWLAFDDEIQLSGGQPHAERGHWLGEVEAGGVWLLPGGRVLLVPPADEPAEVPLLDRDAEIETVWLAERLRAALLARYLRQHPELRAISAASEPPAAASSATDRLGPRPGDPSSEHGVSGGRPRSAADRPPSEATPSSEPPSAAADAAEDASVLVTELLAVAWAVDAKGRALVLRALAEGMRDDPGWRQAAMRLKAGFERGLGDRSAAVRSLCARALVLMAAGYGPRPPRGAPTRFLRALFAVPRAEVQTAALRALRDLPDLALERVADEVAPHIRPLLTHDDPETRRLAAEIEMRLGGGPTAAIAADLASDDVARIEAALSELDARGAEYTAPLLPLVLEAATGDDPQVRRTALRVLRTWLVRAPDDERETVLRTLLESERPDVVRAGLAGLPADGALSERLRRRVDGVLDRLPELRRPVTSQLVAATEALPAADAVTAVLGLLGHRDPVVRAAALEALAEEPPRRPGVRDELLHGLVERLRDPLPDLRLMAARTVTALGYMNAATVVAGLALDPDRRVRQEALSLLVTLGDAAVHRAAERTVSQVDTLFALAANGEGDARIRWTGALNALDEDRRSRVPELLAALLTRIPADTSDPFLSYAIEEIDRRLLDRAEAPSDLLSLCRRLVEPPESYPTHAARLAGAVAADEPAAMHFLWTLYVETDGVSSDAARRVLAALAPVEKSDAVRETLRALADRAQSGAQRDVLRRLLG